MPKYCFQIILSWGFIQNTFLTKDISHLKFFSPTFWYCDIFEKKDTSRQLHNIPIPTSLGKKISIVFFNRTILFRSLLVDFDLILKLEIPQVPAQIKFVYWSKNITKPPQTFNQVISSSWETQKNWKHLKINRFYW